MPSGGIGGLMVAGETVVVSGRDSSDSKDLFVGLELATGKRIWKHEYEAAASLDYGSSPRATPTFSNGVLVTLGATGVVCGLDPATGVELWKFELTKEYRVPTPTWGFCGSPLVVDGSVMIQVAKDPSLVSLDLFSGELQWRVKNESAAYSSLMLFEDDKKYVVGVSDRSYFLRQVDREGEFAWSAEPENSGDFGVPVPVVAPNGLIFTSENNGIQLFARENQLGARPTAVNDELIPDSHTPVLVGDQLLVAYNGLHSLDIRDSLTERWRVAESAINGYASIIASDRCALVTTEKGELLLVSIEDNETPKLLGQQRLTSEKVHVLSHPAVHGSRLFVRVGAEIRCYRLPR